MKRVISFKAIDVVFPYMLQSGKEHNNWCTQSAILHVSLQRLIKAIYRHLITSTYDLLYIVVVYGLKMYNAYPLIRPCFDDFVFVGKYKVDTLDYTLFLKYNLYTSTPSINELRSDNPPVLPDACSSHCVFIEFSLFFNLNISIICLQPKKNTSLIIKIVGLLYLCMMPY